MKKLLLPSALLLLGLFASASAGTVLDWPVAAGDDGATRYSPLSEIDRSNVARLEVAWSYRHGDVRSGWPDPFKATAFEASPIVVDGRLIFSTPFNRVIALDPETGREIWTFDPEIDKSRRFGNLMVNRGVAYWRSRSQEGTCARRVFLATLDARLISLDAATRSRAPLVRDHWPPVRRPGGRSPQLRRPEFIARQAAHPRGLLGRLHGVGDGY